jgi:uncharacterized protein YcfJ
MNNLRKAAIAAVAVGTAITGGAIGASVVGTAGAQTDNSSSSSSSTAASTAPDPSQGGHTANGITEQLLTGDTATQVTNAAKNAVPDATIDRVETDAEGAAYEVHMTKSDGSIVTVKLDSNFKVTQTINGMG